ncbi:hypothetical protein WU87_07400 [Corynebacterium minutissimum]|uniref:Uncharacterized protein n=1 Tax=Corynebacterium minutissimum TaxID=38301 RepID=A0ACC4UA55_9CORY|nr:hypothetical protein WU87_07400 [Corynebacterium minutissimum]
MSNPYAAPQFSPEPTPEQAAPKKKKKGGCLKWGAGAIAVLVLGSAALNAGSDGDDPTNTAASEPSTSITAVDINNAAADVESAAGDTGSDDNAVPTEHKNALRAAKRYVDFSAFSEAKLYDQLTSEYGSQFSPEAAQYAVDTVNADWMAEAVEAAENYQEMMPMSGPALLDQLTSEYGEKFTMEEAQHAVSTLAYKSEPKLNQSRV